MLEEQNVEIFEPPSNRRYWIVKADAGKYYDTFIENSVIAIGHLDKFSYRISNENPLKLSSIDIKNKMTIIKGEKKYFNANNYGQVNSFINEMKIGDWVLTKSSKYICIGQIRSEARYNNLVLKSITNKGEAYEREIKMDYMLKRNVCWGPKVKINHIPTDIDISLRSPMTLYNIDKHMESICYTIFPYFKINDSLHLSIRINQEDDISNYYLTKIFEYLNELDFLSRVDLNQNELELIYLEYVKAGTLNLSTQASFHSPGDIWAKILFAKNKSKSNMVNAIIIYSMLFGNSHLGVDGVLDLESRKKIWDTLIHRIDMDVMGDTVKELNLSMPKYNTKEIEDNSENITKV